MSYVGNTNTTQGFTPAVDYFSGNGSTVAFTLSRPVASVAQVQANISNVPQNPSSAFSVSGNTITFTSAPPSGTNNIYVYYTSPITQVIAPGQGTVSPTSLSTGGPYWDTSGNVGIGTASPTVALDVAGAQIRVSSSSYLGVRQTFTSTSTNGRIYQIGSNFVTGTGEFAIYDATAAANRFAIDSSGNVGIGTTSPACRSDISGSATAGMTLLQQIRTGSGNAYGFQIKGNYTTEDYIIQNYYSGALAFGTTNTERARIDASGNLLVGTTTIGGTGTYRGLTIGGGATQNLGVTYDYAGAVYRYNSVYENGWVWWNERSVGGPVQEFFVTTSFTKVGNINCTTTATNYVTSSDYRLKENIQPMTGALAKVAQLKPCTYTWKVDGSEGQGFIAHELGEVVPQCVSGEKDAVNEDGSIDPQGIDTSFLVATLTAAIQELKALVDTQASTITSLTDRITALENK